MRRAGPKQADVSGDPRGRRRLIAGLGSTAFAAALATNNAHAGGQRTSGVFQPARHAADAWLVTSPAKHRVILDTTSAEAIPDAVRFAGNLFARNKAGYGVAEADVRIVICSVTAQPGRLQQCPLVEIRPPLRGSDASGTAPTVNPYNSGARMLLTDLFDDGAQFMVCGTASVAAARRAAAPSGNPEAVFREMEANLVPGARMVAAGVVGVTHAQEYGYSYLFVG